MSAPTVPTAMGGIDLSAIPPLLAGAHAKPEDGMCELAAKLAKNTVISASGCHLWMGYIQPNGYGYVNIRQYREPAHRLALKVAGIHVPSGMDVCHRCDIRNCVNPDHLYVGTRRQNMADCSARDRHNKPKGQAHWCAKLSEQQVVAIRERRRNGETVTRLAQEYGVHHGSISRIARGVWRKEVAV